MEKIELLSSRSSPTGSKSECSAGRPATLPFHKLKLKMPVVVLMIIGKIVGAGLILIPTSISATGWIGIGVLVTCFVSSSISGAILARSWLVLMRWFPTKYAEEIDRHPYPSIGYETFGMVGRRVVSIAIDCYSFLFATALYLLGADSLQLFFQLLNVHLPLCLLIAVFIMTSAPLLWVGTPQNMIAAGIASGASSVLIYLCLTMGSFMAIDAYPAVGPVSPTVLSVTGALGLIMTSFGGQFVIPTIQHDMKNPEDMPTCVVLAYTEVSWKRILLRSVISIAMLLVALSLPNFSIFLSVVGGALVSVLNGVIPTILYLKLSRMEPPPVQESEGPLRWYQALAISCVIIAFVVGGVLSTVAGIYNAMDKIANSTLPCFVSPK